MFPSTAAFYADATEQLNYSSLNVPTWDSSAYYPPIETASGAYYCNYWNEYEYSYAPVYYGFQHYPELYQPFVLNVYGGLQNDYQTAYFDIYGYPVPEHFVPVVYYPVYYVPVTYIAIDVPSQHHDEYDLNYPNDFQYTTLENRHTNDSYESFEGVVGEASTTCHLYYEEGPEKINDDPNDDQSEEEANSNSSNGTVANAVVSTTSDINANTAVQVDEGSQPCTTNTNRREDVDVKTFLERLSMEDFMKLKGNIDGTYNDLKEDLYNDVNRGYSNMKEFLKKYKLKWDRSLTRIRDEEKLKKSFDMEQYYFHDVLRIPKGSVRYEDAAEKYILYQLLGSLDISLLKRFMKKNYNKHKRRVYKEECKGHTKIKKQLRKLKWRRSSLCSIPEGEKLEITEEKILKNFIHGLRNITSENSSDVNYLLDVLKKSVLTSTPESEESEEIQEVFTEEDSAPEIETSEDIQEVFTEEGSAPENNTSEEIQEVITEEDIAPDCQIMIENPQLSVFLTDDVENDVYNTPDISVSKEELDLESQKVAEYLKLVESASCVAEYSEECDVQTTPDISISKGEHNVENEKIIEVAVSSSYVAKDSKNDPVLYETELPFCTEDSGTEKIEDAQTSTPSEEKIGENERPFAPPMIEMDSVSFGEEDLSPVSLLRIEEPLLDVPSSDRLEEMEFPLPPVISEPTTLAAAAEKSHHKKRFSSLRKFLSRICCCRKKPPS